jgi:hypothetical protein
MDGAESGAFENFLVSSQAESNPGGEDQNVEIAEFVACTVEVRRR